MNRPVCHGNHGQRHQLDPFIEHGFECVDIEVAGRVVWHDFDDDAAFASVLRRAIRGELSAPELSSIPELAGLPAALSARAERYPTLLAMIAMGLSTVEAGSGTLDETLENLEELCVSSLYTSGVLADDDERPE